MIVLGIIGSICFNNLPETNQAILNEGTRAIEFAITLAAIMSLWMGIMNIANDSGLIDKIANKISPLMKKLFPNAIEKRRKKKWKWTSQEKKSSRRQCSMR